MHSESVRLWIQVMLLSIVECTNCRLSILGMLDWILSACPSWDSILLGFRIPGVVEFGVRSMSDFGF